MDCNNTGEEMKFKPDLNRDTSSPASATRTSSRNERQQGGTARSGTLLNHFWQHFGKNYLNVGTFLPLLTILWMFLEPMGSIWSLLLTFPQSASQLEGGHIHPHSNLK